MEEMFDIFDKEGNHLGTRSRSFCHSENPGVYHKPVWIWVINEKNEILLQQRSFKKKNFPGVIDAAATGHVDAGEAIIQGAKRELKEELQIDVKEEKITHVGQFLAQQTWELGQIYLVKIDSKTKIVFDENEIEKVFWVDFETLKKMFKNGEFAPYEDGYTDLIVKILSGYLQ